MHTWPAPPLVYLLEIMVVIFGGFLLAAHALVSITSEKNGVRITGKVGFVSGKIRNRLKASATKTGSWQHMISGHI